MTVQRLMPFAAMSVCIGLGCASSGGTSGVVPSTQDALRLSSPSKIEILPFSKPKSFDRDPIPDGVEVTLRATDRMGDPTKAWGVFRFELFTFRSGSGERRGDRLKMWEVTVGSIDDQVKYWDRVTQTYRFQLGWEGEPLAPNKKYVLEANFQPPETSRPDAQLFVFEFVPPDRDTVRAALGGKEPNAAK